MKKSTTIVGIAIAAILTVVACYGYAKRYLSTACTDRQVTVLVPTGASYNQLKDSLRTVMSPKAIARFDKIARLKKLDTGVRGGRYVIEPSTSVRSLVSTLRGGLQSPVRLTFNNVRTIAQLSGRIAAQIEPDSIEMLAWLQSAEASERYGLGSDEMIGLFLPDTYEVWWTLTPEQLTDRMKKEYDNFWNSDRTALLSRTKLDRKQVVTLASIVYEETKMSDEMPTVAGVYINRLRIGMPLQADPTVKFALGDFTLRRILTRHLSVDSPYNTYIHTGLPPAPICMPSKKAIDAVLNYKEHNYLYFCAKEDFSGYHNFATNLADHNRNAARYSQALNRAGIR